MFITLSIQLPLVLRFIDVPFRQIFRVVTIASFVMVAMEAVRIWYVSNLSLATITQQKLAFVPLSILACFPGASFSGASFGFLSHINVFEFLWIFLMIRGLAAKGKVKRIDAALVVLLMWTILLVIQWGVLMYFENMKG